MPHRCAPVTCRPCSAVRGGSNVLSTDSAATSMRPTVPAGGVTAQMVGQRLDLGLSSGMPQCDSPVARPGTDIVTVCPRSSGATWCSTPRPGGGEVRVAGRDLHVCAGAGGLVAIGDTGAGLIAVIAPSSPRCTAAAPPLPQPGRVPGRCRGAPGHSGGGVGRLGRGDPVAGAGDHHGDRHAGRPGVCRCRGAARRVHVRAGMCGRHRWQVRICHRGYQGPGPGRCRVLWLVHMSRRAVGAAPTRKPRRSRRPAPQWTSTTQTQPARTGIERPRRCTRAWTTLVLFQPARVRPGGGPVANGRICACTGRSPRPYIRRAVRGLTVSPNRRVMSSCRWAVRALSRCCVVRSRRVLQSWRLAGAGR